MKFLICSDGSEQADRAIRLGAAIAAGCQAEVTLFGIAESEGSNKTILDSLQRGQSLLEDKKIHAELITKSGDPIEEIRQGDVVRIPAGQKHWHGASPATAMTHIAIQEQLDGKAVDWMEKVSDEQYDA